MDGVKASLHFKKLDENILSMYDIGQNDGNEYTDLDEVTKEDEIHGIPDGDGNEGTPINLPNNDAGDLNVVVGQNGKQMQPLLNSYESCQQVSVY